MLTRSLAFLWRALESVTYIVTRSLESYSSDESGEASQQYFSDGTSEDLITALSQQRVMPWASAAQMTYLALSSEIVTCVS
jgi:TolB-like protein